MNSGTQPTTAAETEQQNIAAGQMQDYFKTQLPALGYAIKTSQQGEAGAEQQAAGANAASGRVATNQALNTVRTNANVGSLPGSGNYASKYGGIMAKGAAGTGEAASMGRLQQKSNYIGSQQGIIGVGNNMLAQADRGLVTEGGIAQGIENANAQAKSQNSQQAAALATTALLAFA